MANRPRVPWNDFVRTTNHGCVVVNEQADDPDDNPTYVSVVEHYVGRAPNFSVVNIVLAVNDDVGRVDVAVPLDRDECFELARMFLNAYGKDFWTQPRVEDPRPARTGVLHCEYGCEVPVTEANADEVYTRHVMEAHAPSCRYAWAE